MKTFTQMVLVVGRITPDNVTMMGTGFLVDGGGVLVTTHHVVGSDPSNLVVLMPQLSSMGEYQDIADLSCKPVSASIVDIDPIRDIAILKADVTYTGPLPSLGSFDECRVGDEIAVFGYPHCVEGRRALTYQRAEVGAKVLVTESGIKTKHAVINSQARPGQSGSLVFDPQRDAVSGMLLGAWAPVGEGGISLGGINPRELHQTTHCVSANHIKDMLK